MPEKPPKIKNQKEIDDIKKKKPFTSKPKKEMVDLKIVKDNKKFTEFSEIEKRFYQLKNEISNRNKKYSREETENIFKEYNELEAIINIKKYIKDNKKFTRVVEILTEEKVENEKISDPSAEPPVMPHEEPQEVVENLTEEKVENEKISDPSAEPPVMIHEEPQEVENQQKNPVQLSMEDSRRIRTEQALREIPESDIRKLIFQISTKNMNATEVPKDFEVGNHRDIIDSAALFLLDKKILNDQCLKMKGLSDKEESEKALKNEARIWRDNYNKSLERSLDRLKLSLHEKFVKEKGEMLRNTGNFSDEEIREILKKESLEYDAQVIFRLSVPLEAEICKSRADSELSEKDMNLWQKGLAKYRELPQWKRLGISVGFSAAIGAGIVFAGTGAVAAAATVGVARAGRTLAGGAISAGLRGLSEFVIGKKYEKKREAELTAGEAETLRKLEAQVATWEKEGEQWEQNEAKKLKLMRIVDETAIDTNKKLETIEAKERNIKRIATVTSGLIGGGSVFALSTDFDSLFSGSGAGEAGKRLFSQNTTTGYGEELAVAKKGDSVWTLIDENATKIKGFNDLNEAQQTYFIDRLKDQVVADPQKFGLENADQIKIGYGKELGQLFENNQDIQQILESAKNITKEQINNITQTNITEQASSFESIKPNFSNDVLIENSPTNENIINDEKYFEDAFDQKSTFSVKGIDGFGVETIKELPIEFKENNELAQAYLNYKGNPNFVEGSQAQEWAQQNGAEVLVKLAEQHPEYLKIEAFRDSIREIHTNNLIEEISEGGAFKFLNSADHADLLYEVKNLAKTYGFDSYRADSFADYISQVNEMNEKTFTPFIDNNSGLFLSDRFYESVQHFNELAKSVTPPKILEGEMSSIWEPRLIVEPNSDPIIGLVRQSSPGIFEYKTPTGHIGSGLNETAITEMIVKPPSIQK